MNMMVSTNEANAHPSSHQNFERFNRSKIRNEVASIAILGRTQVVTVVERCLGLCFGVFKE